ncbi:radical SAM protein [Candidatus Sumerlaeota bacterium]|nr:radical SAM protein [Candidatus Sumerlaeota bacterium]
MTLSETQTSAYRYVFGPVASRRFGLSLGVDLVPLKTCTYDCIYCQLGPTRARTVERREWAPTDVVKREFRDWLAHDGKADVVSLAGSGEPTLHAAFGEILDAIRDRCPIPTVLLTNGSLLHLPEVRAAAARAHRVKVTFSAPDEETWRALHRPSPELRFDDFVEGIRRFREEYAGDLAFEVMAVEGVNSDPDRMARIAKLAQSIGPDRVQINVPVRPPCERTVRTPSAAVLERLAVLFDPRAEILGVEAVSPVVDAPQRTLGESEILGLISRHPASADEVARALGADERAVLRLLERMTLEGRVARREREGRIYFASKLER